jgi:pSer/pThr/pTyr-binding forkhead associated (FHA) protein
MKTASASLSFRVQEGERRFPLESGHMWNIGRGEDNDLVISDSRVSRKHAVIQ